jgi:hypothetical protein
MVLRSTCPIDLWGPRKRHHDAPTESSEPAGQGTSKQDGQGPPKQGGQGPPKQDGQGPPKQDGQWPPKQGGQGPSHQAGSGQQVGSEPLGLAVRRSSGDGHEAVQSGGSGSKMGPGANVQSGGSGSNMGGFPGGIPLGGAKAGGLGAGEEDSGGQSPRLLSSWPTHLVEQQPNIHE